MASGLAHIHDRRILYRDLQPRNVLFDEWSTVRLVDFDVACSLDGSAMSDISGRPVVEYMAPEELERKPADEKADLYSLGATMYEVCTGRAPYAGDRQEILAAKLSGQPPPLEREDLPEGLSQLIFALMAAQPERRPPTALAVVKQLEQLHAARVDLQALLNSDESAILEFKSSLRVPIADQPPAGLSDEQRIARERKLERDLERAVIKTIAAFLNTDGGTIVIGADNTGRVVGIEADYPRVKEPSRDGWLLTFDEVISRDLRPDVTNCLDVQIESLEGRTVAVVRCTSREEPTWLGKDELFFVRHTAGTAQLSPREAVAWCRDRAGKQGMLLASEDATGSNTHASRVARAGPLRRLAQRLTVQ